MTSQKSQNSNMLLAFLTLLGVIVLVAVVGFFMLRKGPEIIQGQAEVTEYRVSSKVPGRILEFRVKEGQKVQAGDTLAILEAPDVIAKMEQARAAEAAAQAQNEKAIKGARQEQIQAAYEMVDGNGGIAVLSATAQATNQNLWIEWMKKELEENPEKYANTPLVKVAYGDDDPTKSTSETQALLTDSSIKVIIAPTTVGMLAAGKVLQDKQSDVKLTGLGLPSEMAPFIEDGTCPWMYLWNPVDIGYLSGYTMDALVKGTITGDVGGSFNAGDLGEKKITEAADGGTEVMLGDPFKFDTENIAEWKEVY